MTLALIAAVLGGAFCTSLALWSFGFGAVSIETSERLRRLRESPGSDVRSSSGSPTANLRKRASVTFGGLNLVSGNLAQKWTLQLDRAGLTLNVREYFALRVAVGLAMAAVIMLLLPLPILGVLGIPAGFFLTGFWVSMRISKRQRMFETQLAEMLAMMASALRAGFGLMQALESAAEQLPAPISTEVRRTLRDVAMGASVEQALETMNERVGSSDFDIVCTAVLIQRSVGGNLAEILDTVAHTMRERDRIRGEIRTLTSQQRMTGYVIGGIPFGLLAAFWVINPQFTGLLFTDSLGQMMLAGAGVMEVLGFLVIRQIVNIEV